MTTRIEPLLRVADLDLMPDDGNRYEIIEGELFGSCAPSLIHQLILSNIIRLIGTCLNENPIGIIVPGPGVIFSDLSGVIPDLVFISNEKRRDIASGDRVTGAPELVVEILSPGTENERRDREIKRQLYGKYGVQEYWIVDPGDRSVQIYGLEEQTLILTSTLSGKDQLTSPLLPGLRCEVESIFVS